MKTVAKNTDKSVDRRTILASGALALAGAATQTASAQAQSGAKPIFTVPAITIPIAGETDVFPVRRIYCIGRNYAAHAKEMGAEAPAEPMLFLKPPSALLDPSGTVLCPPESAKVEHEAELTVVIGKRAKNVPKDQALSYVFGYTCACDVTARDIQRKDVQFTRGKGFDTFCPLGPVVQTELDPSAVRIQCRVNGQTRQDGNTKNMIFDVPTLVAYVSRMMTLEPGDVILTGTPEGVGPLTPGDALEVEVDGIGTLQLAVGK